MRGGRGVFARWRSGPPSGSVIASPSATATRRPSRCASPRRLTGERFMHDPKEEKKGGFGAFVQRDRERREAEELKNASNGTGPAAPREPKSPATSPDASGSA